MAVKIVWKKILVFPYNESKFTDLIEEERELVIPRVSVLLEHPPPQLGPLVHQHLTDVAIGGVVIEESWLRILSMRTSK